MFSLFLYYVGACATFFFILGYRRWIDGLYTNKDTTIEAAINSVFWPAFWLYTSIDNLSAYIEERKEDERKQNRS